MTEIDKDNQNPYVTTTFLKDAPSFSKGTVTPKELIDHFKWILGVIILFIVLTLFGIVIDICRNNDLQRDLFELKAETQIIKDEVGKNADEKNTEVINKHQKILDCLSVVGCWQYDKCFK